jgi:hypothetical protein
MVEQPIQNVRRLTDVTRDDLCVERDPEIGDMRVDANAAPSRREVLRMEGGVERVDRDPLHAGIRTRCRPLSPRCG